MTIIAACLAGIVAFVALVGWRCYRNASPSISSSVDSCADWGREGQQ